MELNGYGMLYSRDKRMKALTRLIHDLLMFRCGAYLNVHFTIYSFTQRFNRKSNHI